MKSIRIKRIVSLSLILIMMVTILPVNVEAGVLPLRVVVDNEELVFPDAKPFIDSNNRTQIPARFIAESLGATVTWDQELKQAKFKTQYIELLITIDSDTYELNGRTLKMDTKALIKDDRTFVPARYVAEAFGAEVGWDPQIWTVLITSNQTDEITTGGGDVQIINGVEFDPVTDLNIYNVLTYEKHQEFLLAATKSFRFIKENGVIYVEGEYPEAPEDHQYLVTFTTYRKEGIPFTMSYTSWVVNEELFIPQSGSFKKENVVQDEAEIAGYNLTIQLIKGNGRLGILNLHKDREDIGIDYQVDYQTLSGTLYTDYTDQIDESTCFVW